MTEINEIEKAVVCGIEVDANTVGVWFAGGRISDTLVILYKDGASFHLQGRVRIYDPADLNNDPWSRKDIKVPIALTFNPDISTALVAAETVREWLKRMPFFEKFSEFLMEGRTLEDFVNEFTTQSFNHRMVIPAPKQLN